MAGILVSLLAIFFAAALLSPLAHAQADEEPIDDQDIEEEALSDQQLRRLHQEMDSDGNGRISLQETLKYATDVGRKIAGKDVGAILDEIDTSKDGKLSLEEHMSDIRNQADGGDEEEMKELEQRIAVEKAKFHAADSNGNNELDVQELTSLFYPETHDGVLAVTVAETLRQKDKNGDGKLTEHEFWEAEPADGDDGQLTEEEHVDFAKLDHDGDKHLSLDEMRGWESGKFHTEQAMKKLFEVADTNSDMHLSVEELVAAREQIAVSDAQYHLIEWAEHHEL